MSVSNGQPANSTTFNNAFVSKISDSTVTGKVTLNRPGSGNQIDDVQEAINNNKAAIEERVSGPASSAANRIPVFDGTTGKAIKESTASIDDSGNMSVPGTLTVGGVAFAPISTAKATITYQDLSAEDTTNDIEALEVSANELILGIIVKHSESFQGGSISAYTLDLGISGELNRYVQSLDVFQAAADGVYVSVNMLEVPSFAGTTSIRLQATSTGDNLDQATQGSVDIWVIKTTLS